uniref:SET domain-containing protein n=1 Tax=Culex tarsalis TaxID=7177 RepID=A0A1Q3EXH6_CULTA
MNQYNPPTVTRLQNDFCDHLQRGRNVLDPSLKQKEVLQLVISNGQLGSIQELGKSNATATTLRNTANRFYRERNFEDALTCYNESICYAEPDSDQLAMGYANRSAVYYEQGEYEFALYNIDLAKRNNYPEKLMPKLLAREDSCKQQIAAGHSKGTVPCPRMDINLDTSPTIPFMADEIGMKCDPKFGRGLYAERDFNPGDIILNEKIKLCGLDYYFTYQCCNQCGTKFNYSLIPCPTCPFFMFCSQECLELNWKLYHRFECSVATKLCSVSGISDMLLPRLFLYGLSQFEDDLQTMMAFCEPEVIDASNPLTLNLTNCNRLEVFKALHNTVPHIDVYMEDVVKSTAASYYAVFLMNPTVSSIFRTGDHRRFFLRSLLKNTRVAFALLTSSANAEGHTINVIRPIGSLLNHSCDPNAIVSIDSGRAKVILLRPVRKGEQIFTTNGPAWWLAEVSRELHFKCQCVACDLGPGGREWRKLMDRQFPPNALQDFRTLQAIINREETRIAAMLIAIQQFIKRYAHLHPQKKTFGSVLKLYNFFLCKADRDGNMAMNRTMLQAKFVEQ